ncbi:MAG: sugar transferase [Candidatus Brocadiaceae bacterium]
MANRESKFGKRFFDTFLAFLILMIFLPLFSILSVLLHFAFGKPIFFRQVRPGFKGMPFFMYKFCTMTNERDVEGKLLPDEKRLTRLGRFLRSTSLDELPELINVLKGDMSLVGPRPLLMEYLPLYSSEQARRHEVKPGITDWVQVNGSSLNLGSHLDL